ncbi:MAG: GlmU family protein [Bacteroidota bacterium]|nr:GlmU family protein [Bacteroidota bacterium]
MKIQLVDGKHRDHLLPLTYTRPVAQLRCGILTIVEKYQKRGFEVGYETEDYLQEKFPSVQHDILVSGSVCPTDGFIHAILSLTEGQALIQDDELLAFKGANWADTPTEIFPFNDTLNLIIRPWDIWTKNAAEMNIDFDLLTKDRYSAPIDASNTVFGDRIFLEEGARVKASILNATLGPIYLAHNAEVMEGSIVRGGLALGANSILKLGTKVYGATTLGPYCKVGGEINNSVILGYSNKGHDGFIGNSVVGEWCNLGADTNNSNLKNNYDEVKAWSYVDGRFSKTDQQFCGLIMGDHSKSGINTMFNTGTVVGVSANIYGAGFPRNFIPSFTWGGPQGTKEYLIKKALDTANRMMQRRGLQLDDVDRAIMERIYADSAKYRS